MDTECALSMKSCNKKKIAAGPYMHNRRSNLSRPNLSLVRAAITLSSHYVSPSLALSKFNRAAGIMGPQTAGEVVICAKEQLI